MMRRTTPRHALPLIKLLILATRQITKPFAKMVVSSASEVKAIDVLCIAMGRFVLGSTGVLKQESAKQRAALEEKAKAKQRETELIAHVIIEVEERLKNEMEDLRRQLAEAQEAHNALLSSFEEKQSKIVARHASGDPTHPSSEVPSEVHVAGAGSAPSAENQPDSESTTPTAPQIYVCPLGTYNRPALPTHKPIFGTDNNPPIFPPEPRIEAGPFTIPVVAIEVPLGDLSTTIKARESVSAVVAPSSVVEDKGDTSSASSVTTSSSPAAQPQAIPPNIDHVQSPQFAFAGSDKATVDGSGASSAQSSQSSSASSSSSLPTDDEVPFRISAMPTVSVASVDSFASRPEQHAKSIGNNNSNTNPNTSKDSASVGITLTGGAASVPIGLPKKPAAAPSSSSPDEESGSNVNNDSASEGCCSTASRTTVTSSSNSNKKSTKRKGGSSGFNFHKSIHQAFQDRYYSRVSDDTLRKAGAEMLVELIAFSILSLILTYEYVMAKRSEQAREKAQLERITALEHKVNEIAAKHDSSIAALTVGTSELDGTRSLLRRVFGGGKKVPTADDEAQTDGGEEGVLSSVAPDESSLDLNQRMLRRGLTP